MKVRIPLVWVLGLVYGVVAVCMVGLSGCEWTATSDADAWSERMSWVNFSGVYRGAGGHALVRNFSTTGVPSTTTSASRQRSHHYHTVTEESGGNVPTMNTLIEGGIPYRNHRDNAQVLNALGIRPDDIVSTRIFPGSLTLTFRGPNTGAFTDDGSGGMDGNFFLAGPDDALSGMGAINYDTGSWNLTLQSPGFMAGPIQVVYSYLVEFEVDPAQIGDDEAERPPPTSHGWVHSLVVEQSGNHLRFTDNRGFVWKGQFSQVTTPGGDTAGRTSGEVIAVFEAFGETRRDYKITGTFGGNYTRRLDPEGAAAGGRLTRRHVRGLWVEPRGHGDLYGVAYDEGEPEVIIEDDDDTAPGATK